jgi:anti-anti-sigma regulatory factor
MIDGHNRILVVGLKQSGVWSAGKDRSVTEALDRAAAGSKAVLLDFSAVNSLETVALAGLLRWIRKASEKHVVIGLCHLTPQVRIVAQMLGIHHTTPIFNDSAEAERVLIPVIADLAMEAAASAMASGGARRRDAFLHATAQTAIQDLH